MRALRSWYGRLSFRPHPLPSLVCKGGLSYLLSLCLSLSLDSPMSGLLKKKRERDKTGCYSWTLCSGFGFFFFKFGIWAGSQVVESSNFQTFEVWFTSITVIKGKPVFAPFYPNSLRCFINNKPRYLENSIHLVVSAFLVLYVQMSQSDPHDLRLPECTLHPAVALGSELYWPVKAALK